jgi:hypothetical protein
VSDWCIDHNRSQDWPWPGIDSESVALEVIEAVAQVSSTLFTTPEGLFHTIHSCSRAVVETALHARTSDAALLAFSLNREPSS